MGMYVCIRGLSAEYLYWTVDKLSDKRALCTPYKHVGYGIGEKGASIFEENKQSTASEKKRKIAAIIYSYPYTRATQPAHV